MDAIKRLRRKLERHQKLTDELHRASQELHLAVYEVHENEPTSGRAIARELGVNYNTLKDWLKNGRQLAEERAGRHSDAPDRPDQPA